MKIKKNSLLLLFLLLIILNLCPQEIICENFKFTSAVSLYDKVYLLAIRDIEYNIVKYKDVKIYETNLLELSPGDPVLRAGADYPEPWVRDVAVSVWNGTGLLYPDVSRNSLRSVLKDVYGTYFISGQYWDAISWVIGVWEYYKFTGDKEFLNFAYEIARDNLKRFEFEEFDRKTGLFMGPASYADGVSSYPEPYNHTGGSSLILDYVEANPGVDKIRMKALSTNCIYYKVYRIIARMGRIVGVSPRKIRKYEKKADKLKSRINKYFWIPEKGHYGYFLDDYNRLDTHMEGLGESFAILMDVADYEKAQSIFNNQYITKYGIPCVWPVFPRFDPEDEMTYGRHCGTVWPFMIGLWATAGAKYNNAELFADGLESVAKLAARSNEFREIYHPVTGKPYGGLQVAGKNRELLVHDTDDPNEIVLWKSCNRQVWSATGYLRMIYYGLFGMKFKTDGIEFKPLVPDIFKTVVLENVKYRDMELDIIVHGPGMEIKEFFIDGEKKEEYFLSSRLKGFHKVEIYMVAQD